MCVTYRVLSAAILDEKMADLKVRIVENYDVEIDEYEVSLCTSKEHYILVASVWTCLFIIFCLVNCFGLLFILFIYSICCLMFMYLFVCMLICV